MNKCRECNVKLYQSTATNATAWCGISVAQHTQSQAHVKFSMRYRIIASETSYRTICGSSHLPMVSKPSNREALDMSSGTALK
mmetsp:Transcript_1305/g.3745  ORF Transcript_1305/g.3745 Transcript_1305/m.3745 type:complete len:83 (+) Transcript_1305:57-305(+)